MGCTQRTIVVTECKFPPNRGPEFPRNGQNTKLIFPNRTSEINQLRLNRMPEKYENLWKYWKFWSNYIGINRFWFFIILEKFWACFFFGCKLTFCDLYYKHIWDALSLPSWHVVTQYLFVVLKSKEKKGSSAMKVSWSVVKLL